MPAALNAGELRPLERSGFASSVISASGSKRNARAHAGKNRIDRLRREKARRAAAEENADDAAAPDRRQREFEVAHQRRRHSAPREPRRARSCELKSQYGHFFRHHGMWMYSASGGSASKSRRPQRATRARRSSHAICQARDERPDRLAAMRQLVLPFERQLGAGKTRFGVEKMRVVAEPAVTARQIDDRPVPSPSASIGSGSSP